MAAEPFQSATPSFTDLYIVITIFISLILLLRYEIDSTWPIAAGAIASFVFSLLF